MKWQMDRIHDASTLTPLKGHKPKKSIEKQGERPSPDPPCRRAISKTARPSSVAHKVIPKHVARRHATPFKRPNAFVATDMRRPCPLRTRPSHQTHIHSYPSFKKCFPRHHEPSSRRQPSSPRKKILHHFPIHHASCTQKRRHRLARWRQATNGPPSPRRGVLTLRMAVIQQHFQNDLSARQLWVAHDNLD